jgi:tetratricopeptide (TPR) repeat protein
MRKDPTLFAAAVLLALAALLPPAPARAALFPQKTQEAERHAQRGAQELQRGQWKKAVENYRKAVGADPRHVESFYGLGVAYMNLRQWNDALGSFSKVIEYKPNARLREAYANSGMIFVETQKYKEATDVFGFAQQLGDLTPVQYYFAGKAYLQMNRPAEALAALRKATPQQQYAQDLYFSLGLLHLQQGQHAEAAAALEQAAKLAPQHAPTLALLGNAYVAQARYAEGEGLLRRALSLDPRQFFAHTGMGYALMNLNRNEEAVGSFIEALKLQPQSYEATNGLGYAHLRLSKFREAATAFEQAARIKPDGAEPALGLAAVAYAQGNYPQMLTLAQQAAQRAPRSADAISMLAGAHAVTGEMDEALRLAQQATQHEPGNYWPHHVVGYVYVRTDRPQEALAAARRAVELRPMLAETQNLLGYVLNQLGQHQEGLAASQRALTLKREAADEGWAYYNIAISLDKLNRRAEAVEAFRKSLAAYQNVGRTLDPDELYLMGNAYLNLEQDKQAVAAFRQAVRIRPGFAQARYNLGVALFTIGDQRGANDEYNALRRLDPERAARLQRLIGGRPARRR